MHAFICLLTSILSCVHICAQTTKLLQNKWNSTYSIFTFPSSQFIYKPSRQPSKAIFAPNLSQNAAWTFLAHFISWNECSSCVWSLNGQNSVRGQDGLAMGVPGYVFVAPQGLLRALLLSVFGKHRLDIFHFLFSFNFFLFPFPKNLLFGWEQKCRWW